MESCAQECNDFLFQCLAFGAPIGRGLESFYAPARVGDGDAPGSQNREFGEPFLKDLEESQFKTLGQAGVL